jgi:hypothetical protein
VLGGCIPRRFCREALSILQRRSVVTGIPAEGRCRKEHVAFAGATGKGSIQQLQSLALAARRAQRHRVDVGETRSSGARRYMK